MEATIDTSSTYSGLTVEYANGVLTFSDDRVVFDANFTLDYDEFDKLTSSVSLICINVQRTNDKKSWGLLATKDGTIIGMNGANDTTGYSGTTMSAETLQGKVTWTNSEDKTEGTITNLHALIDASSQNRGTNLYLGEGSTVVYQNTGLRYTTGVVQTANINKDLITSITVYDKSYIITNNDGTWSKSFLRPEVTNVTGNEQLVLTGGENGSAAANTNPIVVGGAGQLKLEAWGEGSIVLDDDVYMGSSTYASDNSAAAEYGVIRISNDDTDNHYSATLSGKLYLVEDSSIKGTGSEAINITNLITDKAVPTDTMAVDGNYTLTVGGAGINITAKVDIGGLAFVQGYNSGKNSFAGSDVLNSRDAQVDRLSVGENTTLEISGNLTVGSTVQNAGTIVLNGVDMTFENVDMDHYSVDAHFYNKVAGATDRSTSTNGYAEYSEIVFIGGSVSMTGENTLTAEGVQSWENREDVGIVGRLGSTMADTSRFYINSGTVRLSSSVTSSDGIIYSDNTATTYVVGSGATLDAYFNDTNGKLGNDYALVGKTIELREGATLTNTGGNANDNWQQLKKVELKGDATLKATNGNSYGFLAQNYGESILNLNSHTLTKTGDGEFELLNTTVSNGTINVTGGQLVVASKTDNFANGTTFNNATVNVGEDGTLVIKSMKDAAKVASLLTSTTGAGNIALNTNATLDDVNTKATGLLIIKSGVTLTVGNGSNDTASISSFTKGVELAGGTLAFNGAGKDLASLKVSSAGSLKMSNVGRAHQTYTINGTTNLEAMLTVDSAVANEHGTLCIKELTGSGDIQIRGGSNDVNAWGGISLKVDKLTDYTGVINVDGEGHTKTRNYVEFGSASGAGFQTLEGLVVSNEAYSTVHGKGATTIKELTLANATHNYHTYGTGADNNGYSHTISKLTINGSGTIATTGDDGLQAEINIGELKNAESSATGELYITSANKTTQRSIVNLDGGDFDGIISVTASNSGDNCKLALNINDADVAVNAEIKLNGNGKHAALGVGYDTVNVKGISDAANASGTMSIVSGKQAYNTDAVFSSDNTVRTLAINTAGGSYSTSATVGENLNIEKSGEGSQTFSGNVSSFNGSISALAGELAFTAAEAMNVSALNVSNVGTLTVEKDSTRGTVTTSNATLAAGATVNANLTLNAGATLTLDVAQDRAVALDGELTVMQTEQAPKITLAGTVLDTLAGLQAPGSGEVILFSGVDTLEMGGHTYSVGSDVLTATSGVKLSDYFRSDSVNFDDYYIGFNEHGDVYAGLIVPEPATATLSLLALAGLCARRRRASR